MKKQFPIYMLVSLLMAMVGFTACNSDDDDSVFDTIDTSAEFACMINSFKLEANPNILSNLDTVFFSIDLNAARIFNADSLPLGTRVDSLGVSMTFSSVSKAEIIMPGNDGKDTTINFLEAENTPAIDFSRGYITVHLESANTMAKRDYRVYLNVHKMKPDSLAWGDASFSAYPTTIPSPAALKAVEYKGDALCFATGAGKATRATSSNPGLRDWTIENVNIPSSLDINSITASDDALYAIDGGTLCKSSDAGSTWVSTGASMTHIFCTFDGSVAGVDRRSDGSYVYVTYPATTETPVPDDAPVSATGAPLIFTTEWSDTPMAFVVGGRTASGDLTGATWAYDGSQWTSVSKSPLPSIAGVTMVPYFSFKVSAAWVATKRSVLLAFGGTLADGTLSRTVYISFDLGVNWAKAGELMQLPAAIPSLTGAQALVFTQTLSSRAAAGWSSLELPQMPGWLAVQSESESGVKPITSWDCPYIYLFGGRDTAGNLNDKVWRGVINRLTFKPLQ